MSNYDPTQPVGGQPPAYQQPRSPQPQFQAPPQPQPKSSATGLVLIVVSVVAVVAVGVLAFTTYQQHGKANDARDKTAEVTDQRDEARSTLADTEDSLASTEDDLSVAQGTVSDQKTQLAACRMVIKVSSHQYDEIDLLYDVIEADSNGNYSLGTKRYDAAGRHSDVIFEIIDKAGFDTYDDFWAACVPESDAS